MWRKYNHPVNTAIALSNTGDALEEEEFISWIRPAPTTASGEELQRYLLDSTVDRSVDVML